MIYLPLLTVPVQHISQISSQLDSLATLLELLESVVTGLNASEPRTAVLAGIVACARALDDVKDKLPAAGANGSGLDERIQRFKARLVYAFKQDDVLYLRGVLESVQQNLSLALAILQM